MKNVIFALGCFWSPEAVFRQVRGVVDTKVGYSGGHTENPNYRQVCAGDTGHAEVVRVEYDPAVIEFAKLLDVFWSNHNPRSAVGQGMDAASQYRSAIFCTDASQLRIATQSRDAQSEAEQINTQIELAGPFYLAEEYHQRYLEKQGRAG